MEMDHIWMEYALTNQYFAFIERIDKRFWFEEEPEQEFSFMGTKSVS